MIPDDWRAEFNYSDLKRGEAYWLDGNVTSLKLEGAYWSAKVLGNSGIYEVQVDDEPYDDALSCTCTCPRFEDGYLCKHVAAVCFQIEELEETPAAPTTDQDSSQPPYLELLRHLTEQEIRSFMQDLLEEDISVRRRFTDKFAQTDVATCMQNIMDSIEEVLDRYDRWLDYREISDFETDLYGAIAGRIEPQLAKGEARAVFQMAGVALAMLQNTEVDDSDGFYSIMIGQSVDYWEKAIKLAQGDTKQELFALALDVCDNEFDRKYLQKQLGFSLVSDPGRRNDGWDAEVGTYEAQDVRNMLTSSFAEDPDLCAAVIRMVDAQLGQVRSGGIDALTSVWAGREEARFALVRLKAMRAAGLSLKERTKWAEPLMFLSDVRTEIAEGSVQAGRIDEAISILEKTLEANAQGKLRPQTHSGYPTATAERLCELYELEGRQNDLARALSNLANNDRTGRHIEWFDKLKAIVDPDDWNRVRDDVIANAFSRSMRMDFLAHEGMTGELLSALGPQPSSWEALRYLDCLGDEHAHLAVEAIVRETNENLQRGSSSRSTYSILATNLKALLAIAGGKEALQRELVYIRSEYKRRSALLDELNKAGL